MSGCPLVRAWLRQLRLPFNALLSPIYLWGAWLAPGEPELARLVVGWLALHVFLYGGTTAFNSYFDRDEGPIGGMRRPDPVPRGLLTWSLAVQVAGLPVAWLLGPAFAGTYLLLALLAGAYSHPVTRWKASPASSLAVVALGQGGVGSLAGWLAALAGDANLFAELATWHPWWAMSVAASVLVGQYVISQAYQVEEDSRRGDRTVAVSLGAGRALRWALVPAAIGAAGMFATVAVIAGWWWAVPGAALGSYLALRQLRWSGWVGSFELDRDYSEAMALTRLSGLGLSAYLLALIVFS